ncbi:hypothetical protein C6P40_004344, partial [Pichia californica]
MTLSSSFKKLSLNHSTNNLTTTTTNNNNNSNHDLKHPSNIDRDSSFFHGFSLGSPKKRSSSLTSSASSSSSSILTSNDPLYDSNDNNNNNKNRFSPTPINLNQKSLPNDIQRQQRHNSSIKSYQNTIPLNSVSIPIPIPKKLSTSPLNRINNNNNTNTNNTSTNVSIVTSPSQLKPLSSPSCASPIDIFERNVQTADLSNNNNNNNNSNTQLPINSNLDDNSSFSRSRSYSNSNSNSISYSNINNSYLMSNSRPRHLLSENFTSPALDSTVELISSPNFDDIDVVEIPYSRPSQQLFKSHSHVSSSSATATATTSNSDSQFSPKFTFSRKLSNNLNSPLNNKTCFSHNRSKSSLSNLSPPLIKSKSYNFCTCNNNNNNNNSNNNTEINKTFTNIESPLISPNRKSISFYSYSDLINYEKLSSNNNLNLNLKKENDLIDAQDEQDDIDDLKNDQFLENNQLNSNNDLLQLNCPKHGYGNGQFQRRSTYQGCSEDGDAKIDEELTTSPKINHGNLNNNTPMYTVFNSSSSAIDDNDDDNSIHSWIPSDDKNDLSLLLSSSSSSTDNLKRRLSKPQSIIEELASLKSCTTNNSYFEDELQDCSTHDSSSKIGVPV